MLIRCKLSVIILLWLSSWLPARGQDEKFIQENYTRHEYLIPMRDGVPLFTVVFTPKDTSQKYPLIMRRTPYGVHYSKHKMPGTLGPNPYFLKEGYIFVSQDVRGCYMSEGKFENMRPHRASLGKKPGFSEKPGFSQKNDIDESTDTYDTIDWLLKEVPNHNGRVGLWGISYPGFYTSAGMINAHPALKAASPQAPIADWFFDDFYHHGAFFLTHAFNFMAVFGQPRPEPTFSRPGKFEHGTRDGYKFFLDLGPLKNADPRYFKGQIAYWSAFVEHPNYDAFWQARNILPHLRKVAPAVMTVGGWFDAEDLYGPLKTYRAVEKQNPGVFNILVMGPWAHGQWSRKDGTKLGNIHFGANTADYFQKNIELPFFNRFLKDKGQKKPGFSEKPGFSDGFDLPEAYMFETGTNRWRKFERWPPQELQPLRLYARSRGGLSSESPTEEGEAFDEFISDPQRPVPYTEAIATGMTQEYMTDDQRFASRRPDVVVYQSDVLKDNITLAGPLRADLVVSTSGTDSDWIVKLIDVFPENAKEVSKNPARPQAGYQMMVRSEVIRGRFRKSYEKPEPFVPNQPTKVSLELQDVLHTFAKGHRIMIQIHSTWFPLVDRNPQKYVPNIFLAEERDFIKTTQRVYRGRQLGTSVQVGVLPAAGGH